MSRMTPYYGRNTGPMKLMVYDDNKAKWSINAKPTVVSRIDYIYVSCNVEDYPDKEQLDSIIQNLCYILEVDAYWSESACFGKKNDESEREENYYRMRDIIRLAAKTVVLFDRKDERSIKGWGDRSFSIPEIILSGELLIADGIRKPIQIEAVDILRMVYSDDIFSFEIVENLKREDCPPSRKQTELLKEAIWKRASDTSDIHENALMAFFPNRVKRKSKESFEKWLDTLEKANELDQKLPPYDPSSNIGIKYDANSESDKEIPNRLVIYNAAKNQWERKSCRKEGDEHRYLFVSYVWKQFPDEKCRKDLEKGIQAICLHRFDLHAYWIDYVCIEPENSTKDLRFITDTIKKAWATIIVFRDVEESTDFSTKLELQDLERLPDLWIPWGKRIWSLPEIILSSEIYCEMGGRPLQKIERQKIALLAFGRDSEEAAVMEAIQRKGKNSSLSFKSVEVLERLVEIILMKKYGYNAERRMRRLNRKSAAISGEKLYVLMGLLPNSVEEKNEDEIGDTFNRLLEANGIDAISFRERLENINQKFYREAMFTRSRANSVMF